MATLLRDKSTITHG